MTHRVKTGRFAPGDHVWLDGCRHVVVDYHPPTDHYRLWTMQRDDMGWAPGYELEQDHPLIQLAKQAK